MTRLLSPRLLGSFLLLCLAALPASAHPFDGVRHAVSIGDYDSAILALDQHRLRVPDNEEIIDLLVRALRARAADRYRARNFGGALSDLLRAIQLDPTDTAPKRDMATVHASIGSRLLASSDTPGAQDAFSRAIDYDPARTDLRKIMAFIALEHGRRLEADGRGLEAISQYRRALEWDTGSIAAHIALGRAYYAREDMATAKVHLRTARDLATTKIQGLDELLQRVDREFSVARHYQTFEIGGFIVRFEGGERHDLFYQVQPVLQEAKERAARLLERSPRRALAVLIYSGTGFTRAIEAPDWALGLYDGKIRLRDKELIRGPREMVPLIRHEVAHAVMEEVAPGALPTWIHEGIARYLELDRWEPLRDAAHLVAAIKEKRLFTLKELEPPFSLLKAGSDIRLAYAQSAAVIRYIASAHGEPAIADLVTLLAAGRPLPQAIDSVTFYDMATLQSRVNDWVLWEYDKPK